MSNLPLFKENRSSFAQLTRYACIGIATNSAGYLVYLLVTTLGVTPKIAMTFLYGIGVVIGFLGNRNLTFVHKGSLLISGIRCFIAHLCGYFLNLTILLIFVDEFGYAHQLVQAIAIFIVAGFLFITFKIYVFPNQIKDQRGSKT